MENTKIQWAHHTFNPWRGCEKVNAGCTNCYADTLSKRNPGTLGIWGSEAMGATRVVASEAKWKEPAKWNREAGTDLERHARWRSGYDEADLIAKGYGTLESRRPRVFCASLADVLEDWHGPMVDSQGRRLYAGWHHAQPLWVPCDPHGEHDGVVTMNDVRSRLFRLGGETPNLDKMYLTKRPENIRRLISESVGMEYWLGYAKHSAWLGTSVANQETADTAIPELIKCRDLAAKLFLSVEPLVGPVDLSSWLFCQNCDDIAGCDCDAFKPSIDLVIVGGESGPNARQCNVDWILSIVAQCKAAGVACFVKQLGSGSFAQHAVRKQPTGKHNEGHVAFTDKKGGDPSEWPVDLRVREMPS